MYSAPAGFLSKSSFGIGLGNSGVAGVGTGVDADVDADVGADSTEVTFALAVSLLSTGYDVPLVKTKTFSFLVNQILPVEMYNNNTLWNWLLFVG